MGVGIFDLGEEGGGGGGGLPAPLSMKLCRLFHISF